MWRGKGGTRLSRLLTTAIALAEIQKSGPPTGTKLLRADDLREWLFEVQILGESVYEGETFAMRFRFTDNYPLEAPEVVFVTSPPYRSPVVSRTGEGAHLGPFLSLLSAPTHLLQWTLLCEHPVDRVEPRAQRQQRAPHHAEYAGQLQGACMHSALSGTVSCLSKS